MNRVLLAAAVLAALAPGSPAEEPAVRLEVRPMSAPQPALKYQLLPEVGELNPGNPAQNYLKCFMEQQNFFYGKGAVAERASYLSMPLAELPADKLRQYGGVALKQADWAARLDTLDWQVGQRAQAEGLDLLVPEGQSMQLLAEALRVRFRGEVAGRHFDDAVRTARTMLALARHLGEYPAEVANRIGLAVADQALDTLEEMVQQPSCPNLYWALTDLPCPLVDLRRGLQGGRTLVAAELRPLRDEPMTDAQLERLVARLSGVMSLARTQAGLAPRSLRAALRARAEDAERVLAARRRLAEAGGKEDVVRKVSSVQVILLDEKRTYEVRRDERLKLLGLAPWQIDALAGGPESGTDGDGLFADLLPDVRQVRRAQARLDQRVALLRCVEALRLYAAEHDGKLPATLADFPVPLPDDPFTGKAFGYRVEAASAYLRADPSRGYEVTITERGSQSRR
jgi:hypothetical protein